MALELLPLSNYGLSDIFSLDSGIVVYIRTLPSYVVRHARASDPIPPIAPGHSSLLPTVAGLN
jgi:hypothetical protein